MGEPMTTWILIIYMTSGYSNVPAIPVVVSAGYAAQQECEAAGATWESASRQKPTNTGRYFACIPGPKK